MCGQVGTYFVGQYYQVLQQQPDFVYQFYSEASTMIRIDGNTRDTATAMLVYPSCLFIVFLMFSPFCFRKNNNVGFGFGFGIHKVGSDRNTILFDYM